MNVPNYAFYLIISFIAGIIFRSFFETRGLWWWLLAITLSALGAILTYAIQNSSIKIASVSLLISLMLVFFFLGVYRLESALLAPDYLAHLRDTETSVKITGRVAHDPDIRYNSTRYLLETTPRGARVLVTAPSYPPYQYGDILQVSGKLETPIEFPDFNYREFLRNDRIYSVMYRPSIEITGHKGNWPYEIILWTKNKLRQSLRYVLSPPSSDVLAAMTLGDKQTLPEDLKETFNLTGIRHITAISGMHIAILASIVMGMFTYAIGRQRAFYGTLVFLVFYILLVGAPPSAIRAGIMGSILLLGGYLGRTYFATRALILVAGIMLLWNPFYARFDVGFQLSFLAVLGILYITPLIRPFTDKLFVSKKLAPISTVTAMTLGAQISTLPILIYNFGLFSLSAPIVNVLVVPLVPFILVTGFMAIIIGTISGILGIVAAIPVSLLLGFVIFISELFASFSWSAMTISNVPWYFLILFYVVLVATIAFIYKGKYDILR